MKRTPAINDLLAIMARLRSPRGCPWDRQQNHRTLRWHAVEEVYELLDAIEAGDDLELEEELGDVLLQVVFHCQLARERGAFDFERVARRIADKLIRRHPHVFGRLRVKNVDQVWANWAQIKRAEKQEPGMRPSALDGIPRSLPRCCKPPNSLRKAREKPTVAARNHPAVRTQRMAAQHAWPICAERLVAGLLRRETRRHERALRRRERCRSAALTPPARFTSSTTHQPPPHHRRHQEPSRRHLLRLQDPAAGRLFHRQLGGPLAQRAPDGPGLRKAVPP